jgi:hypothetical protein
MGCSVSSYKPTSTTHYCGSHSTNHKPECCDNYVAGDKELMKDLQNMQKQIADMMDLLKSRNTVTTNSGKCGSGKGSHSYSCKGGSYSCKGVHVSHTYTKPSYSCKGGSGK